MRINMAVFESVLLSILIRHDVTLHIGITILVFIMQLGIKLVYQKCHSKNISETSYELHSGSIWLINMLVYYFLFLVKFTIYYTSGVFCVQKYFVRKSLQIFTKKKLVKIST